MFDRTKKQKLTIYSFCGIQIANLRKQIHSNGYIFQKLCSMSVYMFVTVQWKIYIYFQKKKRTNDRQQQGVSGIGKVHGGRLKNKRQVCFFMQNHIVKYHFISDRNIFFKLPARIQCAFCYGKISFPGENFFAPFSFLHNNILATLLRDGVETYYVTISQHIHNIIF